jgi:hypothetical protein
MKKIYSIAAGLLLTASTFAQAPQKMSYQAVIRNSSDALVTSTVVGLKISILQGSSTGTAIYVERQTPSTNANGLVSLEIGTGTIIAGVFANINWATGPYFIKTETDPSGGMVYSIMGTNELMSVPYALFSANSAPGPTGAAGAPGTNGTNGSIGVTGLTGANGTNGLVGATGLTGAAGANGTNGLVGATGLTGAAGANGTNGSIGATGLTGAAGANGTNGLVGATGLTGAAGANGTNGLVGANGLTGAVGANGTNGLAGATGSTGAAGANGINGLAGATGSTGAAGANGTNGLAGATGSTGAAGANGINGLAGATGSTGAAGANGINGLAGATGSTGAAGSNGTNGSIGLTGAAGVNGINGLAGAAGANGTNGLDGSNGLDGAAGINGTNGSIGATGLAGTNGTNGTSGFTHFIGEEFEGGVIFHLWKDAAVEHGLIVDKSDLSAVQAWSNINAVLIGSSAQSLWDGSSNSNAIVAQSGQTNSASALCLNSTNGGQSDWYLPSIQELSLLWTNYYTVVRSLSQISGATQLQPASCWSSAEFDTVNAWYFDFRSGDASPSDKGITTYVRAVRAF